MTGGSEDITKTSVSDIICSRGKHFFPPQKRAFANLLHQPVKGTAVASGNRGISQMVG